MGLLHAVALAAVSFAGSTDNVLLDFSATWCGPCQRMSPIVSKLEREGLPIRKVDVDQERELVTKLGISSIPAFVLIVDGKVVSRVTGGTTEAELRRMLAKIPAPAAAPKAMPKARQKVYAEAGAPQPALDRDSPAVAVAEGVLSAPRPRRSPAYVARGNNSQSEPNTRPEAEFLRVAARIHVQDSAGVNVGTGTIIESRPGRTIILTCGHIFRNMEKGSEIEVELFPEGQPVKCVGRYIRHDDKADIGLLSVATKEAMPVARIAPAGFACEAGESLLSVGCGGGTDPSIERTKVTAIDRYLGPANLECSGIPQQGRSGGGLFTPTGLVVGVCTAADPRDKKGLYCALQPIHELLDTCRLAHLYQPDRTRTPEARLADAQSGQENEDSAEPKEDLIPATYETVTAETDPDANRRVAADALAGAEDAEIVCVIRPIGKPKAASKVVVIHRATPDFVSQLTGQLQNQPEYNRTSQRVAKSTGQSSVVVRANSPKSIGSTAPVSDEAPRPFRRTKVAE